MLLAAMAASIIRYGAPVWAEATDLQWCRRILDRVQRPLAQGITSAFHSTSCEVAVVLAGELPYHLLAKEDARCYNRQQSSPDSRQRRGRIPPSAAELERRRLNRRQRERQRRLEQRQAEVEAQPPPWNELPSSQLAERRSSLTDVERAAITSANHSAR